MELETLKSLWQEQDAKLEKSINLNLHTLDLIQSHKIKSVLSPLYWQNVVVLVSHTATLVLLSFFCYYNFDQLPYLVSGFILIAFYAILFGNCWSQLKVLNSIHAQNDVISIQSSLSKITAYRLYFLRISVLFIPALLSFPVVVSKTINDLHIKVFSHFDIIKQTNGTWWTVQFIAFFILIPLGIWFYREVSYENVNKRMVNKIIEKASGPRVKKAAEYIKELIDLKRDNS